MKPENTAQLRASYRAVLLSSVFSLAEKDMARHVIGLCDTCDALQEALKPLAALWAVMGPRHDADSPMWTDDAVLWFAGHLQLTVGDVRRAAELVGKEEA